MTEKELFQLGKGGDRWIAEKMLESFFLDCGMTESAKVALKTAVLSFYDHNWRCIKLASGKRCRCSRIKRNANLVLAIFWH